MFPPIEDERREFVGQRRIVVEVEGFKVTPPHRSIPPHESRLRQSNHQLKAAARTAITCRRSNVPSARFPMARFTE